jgi:hypothetical protein
MEAGIIRFAIINEKEVIMKPRLALVEVFIVDLYLLECINYTPIGQAALSL